jgi:uncharacterized membrane protein YdjX (TVP38/TMEM64 family)
VSHRLRLAALVLGVGAIAVVVLVTVSRSPSHVRDVVEGTGGWAPFLFVVVAAGLSTAFFPYQLLAAASGLLFGTAGGTPITIAALMLAAVTQFSISRHTGRAALEEVSGPRIATWQDRIERGGFLAILYARIAPFSPFVLINYVSGLTRLGLGTFALATLIPVIPRAFAYTALGGHLDNLDSPEAIVAFAVLVVMGITGALLAWNGAGRPPPRAVWRALRRWRTAS